MRKASVTARGIVVVLAIAAIGAPGRTSAQSQPVATAPDANGPPKNIVWRVDAGVQRRMQSFRRGRGAELEAFAQAGNWWGGSGVIVFAAILWLGGRALGQGRVARIGLRGAEGLAIASALSGIIKGLAGRARPDVTPGAPWHWDFSHGWSDANYFSMPSGHTTATVAFAVAATLAAWRYGRNAGVTIGFVLATSAAWVAFARVFSDQHWLSDVVAGALLGTATSIVLARLHAKNPALAYNRLMLGREDPA